jgi:hypothetical protein
VHTAIASERTPAWIGAKLGSVKAAIACLSRISARMVLCCTLAVLLGLSLILFVAVYPPMPVLLLLADMPHGAVGMRQRGSYALERTVQHLNAASQCIISVL